jgi:hypothetical protein
MESNSDKCGSSEDGSRDASKGKSSSKLDRERFTGASVGCLGPNIAIKIVPVTVAAPNVLGHKAEAPGL